MRSLLYYPCQNYGRDNLTRLGAGWATYSFPLALAQGLAGASPEDLAEVKLTPLGDGLHWEKLDADFSVPALLAGVFGTAAWMAQVKIEAS